MENQDQEQALNDFCDSLANQLRMVREPSVGQNGARPDTYEYYLFEMLRDCNVDNVDLRRKAMKMFLTKMGWTGRVIVYDP